MIGQTVTNWPLYLAGLIILFYVLSTNIIAYSKEGRFYQMATITVLIFMLVIVSIYMEQAIETFGWGIKLR